MFLLLLLWSKSLCHFATTFSFTHNKFSSLKIYKSSTQTKSDPYNFNLYVFIIYTLIIFAHILYKICSQHHHHHQNRSTYLQSLFDQIKWCARFYQNGQNVKWQHLKTLHILYIVIAFYYFQCFIFFVVDFAKQR